MLEQGKFSIPANCQNLHDSLFRNIGGLSLTDKAGVRQLESIWGRTFPDKELQLQDIKDIQVKTTSWREQIICLQALMKYKEGNAITYKTIGYLHDREK